MLFFTVGSLGILSLSLWWVLSRLIESVDPVHLHEKAIFVLQEFFGDIATVELKNEFNISATTFLKNLVYYGKPGIIPNRVIYIKNYEDIQNLVKNFNSNFSTFDIKVSENDLKIECIHEKKKMYRQKFRIKQIESTTNPESMKPHDIKKINVKLGS